MNKLLALPLFAAVSLAATQAQAGHGYYHYAGDDDDGRYEDRRDRSEPRGYDRRGDGPEYAEVTSVQPIYRSVRIEEPRRECWDERVVYEERRGGYYGDNGAGGAIVGAVIGGVLGNQMGHGNGRRAATAIGAVIGAGVGQKVSQQNASRPEVVERTGYEEVCKTVVDHRVEQRIESYDVTYRYGGRSYQTNMPYDPGKRIPVDVNVRPVRY